MPDLRIFIAPSSSRFINHHAAAIWSSISTPPDHCDQMFLIPRLSTFVQGAEQTGDNVEFDLCRGLDFATSFPVHFSPILST